MDNPLKVSSHRYQLILEGRLKFMLVLESHPDLDYSVNTGDQVVLAEFSLEENKPTGETCVATITDIQNHESFAVIPHGWLGLSLEVPAPDNVDIEVNPWEE